MSDYQVMRLSGSLGAEIRGLSLKAVGPEEAETVRSLLIEHQVLFFPDQHLEPAEHVAFGSHFGILEGHPNLSNPFSNEHPRRIVAQSEKLWRNCSTPVPMRSKIPESASG